MNATFKDECHIHKPKVFFCNSKYQKCLGSVGEATWPQAGSIAQKPRSWEAPEHAGSAHLSPTTQQALHLLGFMSPWHTFTVLGQMFLRHRGIERWGQTDLSPSTIWEHVHGPEQKHHTILLVWQKLNSITDFLLKSSGEHSHSLQEKCFKWWMNLKC